MELTLQIPDDIAEHLTEGGADLSRRALESFALEEFKDGRLTKPELRRLLGFGTRWKLDGFLKAHGVYEDYTVEDFEQERQALNRHQAEEGVAPSNTGDKIAGATRPKLI